MAKYPAFMFYPGDWRKDPALSRCSHAAKGMLMDMLCLMFECEPRGKLATNGTPWSDEDICRATFGDKNVLQELIDKGVLSRDEDGAIYSRRMIRDEEIRASRAVAGSGGGSKTQAKLKQAIKQTIKQNIEQSIEQKSRFSYSSSISSSSSGDDSPPTPPPRGDEEQPKADDDETIRKEMMHKLVRTGFPFARAAEIVRTEGCDRASSVFRAMAEQASKGKRIGNKVRYFEACLQGAKP